MKSTIQSCNQFPPGGDSVRPLKNLYARTKRTILAGSLAFLSLTFFSCSNGGSKAGGGDSTVKTPAPLDSIAQHFPHGGGRPVPMESIQQCLDAYVQVMAAYGITADSPSVPITKCPPKTYRITSVEGLTYATFRAWLDSVVNAIDSAGHGSNVWLKIQPGINTQPFVNGLGLDPARTGRITWFIVPALIDSSKAQSQSNNPGGGTGYDVGGLQP